MEVVGIGSRKRKGSSGKLKLLLPKGSYPDPEINHVVDRKDGHKMIRLRPSAAKSRLLQDKDPRERSVHVALV